jgi:hypothetical protein
MGVEKRLYTALTNPKYTFLLFFSIAIIPRIIVWTIIPLDWNSDSYHHWQSMKSDVLPKNTIGNNTLPSRI